MNLLEDESRQKLVDLRIVVPHLESETAGVCYFILTSDFRADLASFAHAQDWELQCVLVTLFQELLRRYTGQKTATVDYRQGSLWRRITLKGNRSGRETLTLADEVLKNGVAFARPEDAEVDGCFSFMQECDEGCDAQSEKNAGPIHLSMRTLKGALSCVIEFDPKMWERNVVESLVKHYQYILRLTMENLNLPIGELEILHGPDLLAIEDWNRTAVDYTRLCVDELFRQQAEAMPDAIALTFEGTSMSYRALSERTSRLAAQLRRLGAGPGAVVGICMDRCNEMVVAMMAVFRAGAAYLPLDPGFPLDRIEFMQEDAQPLLVITQAHLRQAFSFKAEHVVCFDSPGAESIDEASIPTLLVPPRLDDLAYVLYTSGSTGKPKGVQVTHRALTNLLTAVLADMNLGQEDVFLATSTISFDISAFEIFAPLISGARLVIAPRSVAVNGDMLAETVRRSGATFLQATPSGWRILLESGWSGRAGLKMLTAGEVLDRTLARRLLERGAGLWNLYGPTEATIYASGRRIRKDDIKITVGRPLANYTAYILDHNGRGVPVGAIGELFLGGIGIARGYLNRPELTAEKFVVNSVSQGSSRLYRTGDRARFLEDGQIELLGREDNQIKLRGYRIELEEIESILDSHPSVKRSVTKLVDLGDGDQRLTAYIVPRNSAAFDQGQLRDFASRSLPWYMVPSSIVEVASFKLTPSGKVDRKALPPLLKCEAAKETLAPEQQPADDLERTIVECWKSLLSSPDLGLDCNFFEVGGHSLLAARMFTQLGDLLSLKLPIGLLVEAPTPRRLAARIRKMQDSPIGCLVPMQVKGSLAPIYLVHHLLGDILLYRTLADCFAPDRPVFGVQAPVDLTERREAYSLEALAERYVDEILAHQSKGPFHLAGFSSGSTLAFEMARKLFAKGHEVGMLALIDGGINGPKPSISKAKLYWKVTIRKFCKIAFKLHDELSEGPKQFVWKRVRSVWFGWTLRRLERSSRLGHPVARSVEQALALAENAYCPKPYSGSALLIRFHDEAWQFGPDPLMGWGELVNRGLKTVDLPGGHITGMSPLKASHTASILAAHMESAEASILKNPRAYAEAR